jgi:two-component system sensor histidine kinase SenX3
MSSVIAWSLVVVLLGVVTVLLLRREVTPAAGDIHDTSDEPDGVVEREIVDRSREGVIVLSHSLTPTMANPAARAMLGFAPGGLPPTLRSDELESLARRALTEEGIVEAELSLWPRRLTVQVRAMPLAEPYGVALVLEDVTQDARLQQVRRQFVVNASHELKTPVTGLLALGEAARDALPQDVEAAQRLTGQLVREAERLTKLTQDLLDLSRVEDPATLTTTQVALDEVARHEAMQMKTLADERDVAIDVSENGVGMYVNGDEQQLGLMIRNLIDNAIRYSDPKGRVRVATHATEGEVVVSVRDEGIGIPKRDQARVFERFYRVDEGRSRSSGGTGLGLSIVRHVAETHGGHVSLTSELGEGSEFTVRLPQVPEPAA